MITEQELPEIRRMAAQMATELMQKRGRRYTRRLASVCLRIVAYTNATNPPLTTIEQLMQEAIGLWER